MRKLLLVLAIAGTAIFTNAQTLPKPSPGAEVEQQVGATEIEIEYSRPGVKGRTVFGELVPFDKIWRLGANDATTLSTTHSLFFDGQELKAGKYAVFAVPGKDAWEIMFNSDSKSSADDFNKELTALTIKAKSSENAFMESFLIAFDNITDESASIIVMWEKTKVEIPFTVRTKENALSNIEAAIKAGEDLKSVYNNAANYYFGSAKDNKLALKYVDQSVKLGETYGNLFLKARILHDSGDKKQAIELAKKSYKLSEKDASVGYQNFIKGTLDKWSK